MKQAKTDICMWNDIWLDLKQKKVENLTSFFFFFKKWHECRGAGFQQLEYNTALCQGCNDVQNPLVIYFLFLPACLCACVCYKACLFHVSVCSLPFFSFFVGGGKKEHKLLPNFGVLCVCVLQCLQYLFTSHFYIYAVCLLFRGGGGRGGGVGDRNTCQTSQNPFQMYAPEQKRWLLSSGGNWDHVPQLLQAKWCQELALGGPHPGSPVHDAGGVLPGSSRHGNSWVGVYSQPQQPHHDCVPHFAADLVLRPLQRGAATSGCTHWSAGWHPVG